MESSLTSLGIRFPSLKKSIYVLHFTWPTFSHEKVGTFLHDYFEVSGRFLHQDSVISAPFNSDYKIPINIRLLRQYVKKYNTSFVSMDPDVQ